MLRNNIFNRLSLNGSAYQLALLRIIFGLQILFSSSSKIFEFLQLVPGTNYTKTIFSGPFQEFINIYAIDSLQIMVQILTVFFIFGFLTKWITPLLFISFIFLFSFLYSKFDAPVPWLYIWFPLLVFSFSDVSRVWSIDNLLNKQKINLTHQKYRWPIELLIGWYAYIYFAAGLAKIFPIFKGIAWLDGGTSHRIMYDRYLDSALHYIFGHPLFDYSEGNLLFAILTIGALVIELFCVLLFFTNRFNLLIYFLVLAMHSFLFLVGVPAFGVLSLILGVSLINPSVFNSLFKH